MKWLDDGDVQLHHGDVIDVLRSLPAGLVQTVVTSPPYWGLRDYGTGDGQIGLEATPTLYVERMVAVFREARRVLRDDGTLWPNLGDSYASGEVGRVDASMFSHSGGVANRRPLADTHKRAGDPPRSERRIKQETGLKPKDLVGIPWRVAFALQADGWYLRSDIIWNKPNPMPESVTDRPTKAHEYLFLLTKQPRYYFDQDAIREPHGEYAERLDRRRDYEAANGLPMPTRTSLPPDAGRVSRLGKVTAERSQNPAGRNRRSVWTIPTEPFPEAHFATYPQELVRPCILAGTSERGECSECGAPWQRQVERVVGDTSWSQADQGATTRQNDMIAIGDRAGVGRLNRGSKEDYYANQPRNETTGWQPSCTCSAPTRPQTVLDPFVGSGTTALVARKHGRRCIGIDLSAEYLAIAARRLQQLSLFADPVGRSEDTMPEEVA